MAENRIKELRKLRKMTQVELAQKIGVTQGAIQKLENGVMDLTTKWMSSISVALDVKPYELLPQEWQPEEISPEEREILRMIRKTAAPQAADNRDISPTQDSAPDTQQSPQPPLNPNTNGR